MPEQSLLVGSCHFTQCVYIPPHKKRLWQKKSREVYKHEQKGCITN